MEAYLHYKNKQIKTFEKEYENQFNDYRNEDEEEKEIFINEKLSKLPTHQFLKQIKLDELLRSYDGNSLYPSAMWDENSFYPQIETRYAFTRDMNDELVENFNTTNFTK